jgi:predicted dehydrogenase
MQRIAVIGLGMAVKPHMLALRELSSRVEIAACYSPSAERRAKFAEQYGQSATGDIDAIARDDSIRAVAILTPPWAHLDLVQRFAAAGRHILLEKPIEATLERSLEVVETCERAGVKLAIVFQHRFRTAGMKLAELMRTGKLGRLLSASASVRWWRGPDYFAQPGRGMAARDGGGVLLTQAIHSLDLFLDLAGPVREVAAFHANSGLRRVDTEDLAAAAVRLANGAIGVIDATSTAYPGFPERIELAGELGSAVIETQKLRVDLKDGTVIEEGGAGGGGGGADPMAFSPDAHRRLIADFLDAIEQNRAPRTDGRSALRVHRLIAAMLASDGKTVTLSE